MYKDFSLRLTLPNWNRLWESECEIPMKTKIIYRAYSRVSVEHDDVRTWMGMCLCVDLYINKIYSLDVHWNMHVSKIYWCTHLYTIDTVHFSSSLMEIDEALSLDRERVCEKKVKWANKKESKNIHGCIGWMDVCVCV